MKPLLLLLLRSIRVLLETKTTKTFPDSHHPMNAAFKIQETPDGEVMLVDGQGMY
jgi:hypothetical protein